MRIGFDGGCLANRRGFGRFARELLRALARRNQRHELVVFVDRPSLDTLKMPERVRVVPVDVKEAPSKAASADGRRKLGDMLAMGRAAARENLDLFFFPASYSFFPVWNVKRVVVTMHDTLALTQPELVFSKWTGRLAWRAKERAAVAWADRIVTASQSAKRDLMAWFGLAEEKIVMINEGPDAIFAPRESSAALEVARRYGVLENERFLLYVGGLSPHKNLARVIEAFGLVRDRTTKLMLVGDFGDVFLTHIPELRAAVERLGLDGRVIFAGYVPDEDLAHLYTSAYALVQPALMEGFGLPSVEGMACGLPILSSTAGSLPEVVGDAGLFFDPRNVDAMAERFNEMLEDRPLRDRLAAVAVERSKRFTFDEGADMLLAAFEAIDPSRFSARRSA